jgi:plasmid stabilization system protein ParE
MKRYVLSVDAERDLDEIWEFIAQDDVDAADRWIGKLFETFEAIAGAPGLGHTRKDLTNYPVLFWPVSAYLILYRAQVDGIEIVAVTQGARDIPSFLHQRAPSFGPVNH